MLLIFSISIKCNNSILLRQITSVVVMIESKEDMNHFWGKLYVQSMVFELSIDINKVVVCHPVLSSSSMFPSNGVPLKRIILEK